MIRELKLYDLIGESTPDVLRLNVFFDELFTGLTVYTKDYKPDLIFMKGDKYIMEQDLKSGYLWCRYDGFWSVLEKEYKLENREIQAVISYKVIGLLEEAFKLGSLTPRIDFTLNSLPLEEAFKLGSLTPHFRHFTKRDILEEAFKLGSLTPQPYQR